MCNGNSKVYQLYNLYNENKGLICGGLMCGEILNSSCLDFFWNSLQNALVKSRSVRAASQQPAFMSSYLTISHTFYLPYLPNA